MKFRKRPVVVDAFRLGSDHKPEWYLDAVRTWHITGIKNQHSEDAVIVETLDGMMKAERGDWIIKGVKGELYPCKDDVFRVTYDPLDECVPEGGDA